MWTNPPNVTKVKIGERAKPHHEDAIIDRL